MLNPNTSVAGQEGEDFNYSASTSAGVCFQQAVKNNITNMVPVMIAHIKRYGQNMSVWGRPVKHVTFIATLCKFELESFKVNFEFRDETGTVKAYKWLDGNFVDYKPPVKVNFSARVFGSICEVQKEKQVNVLHIQPLEHLNELLAHLMEVTYVCLEGKRRSEEPVTKEKQEFMIQNETIIKLEMISGLNIEQSLIMNIIKNGHPEYGAHRNTIKSQAPPALKLKVDEILEFLTGEGHVYTTTTEDHFKSIE